MSLCFNINLKWSLFIFMYMIKQKDNILQSFLWSLFLCVFEMHVAHWLVKLLYFNIDTLSKWTEGFGKDIWDFDNTANARLLIPSESRKSYLSKNHEMLTLDWLCDLDPWVFLENNVPFSNSIYKIHQTISHLILLFHGEWMVKQSAYTNEVCPQMLIFSYCPKSIWEL